MRALVHGRSIYLVPRPDNTLVVGATMEERGPMSPCGPVRCTNCSATPGPSCRASTSWSCCEAEAGLRPATPDNTPVIGWTALPGVAVASGHFRNGILLAPFTAAAVVDLFAGATCRRRHPVSELILTVNGDRLQVPAGTTIADLVALVIEGAEPKGIAVAVDRTVIPRSEWATTRVFAESPIEIVTAAAGG